MPRPPLLYLLTFNCARIPQQAAPLAAALAPTLPPTPPTLLVLSLQELLPTHYSFLSPPPITPYLSPILSAVATATKQSYGTGYILHTFHHVGPTAIAVLVQEKRPGAVAATTSRDVKAVVIENVKRAAVGLGPLRIGSKGAVALKMDVVVEEPVRPVSGGGSRIGLERQSSTRSTRSMRSIRPGLDRNGSSTWSLRSAGSEEEDAEDRRRSVSPGFGSALAASRRAVRTVKRTLIIVGVHLSPDEARADVRDQQWERMVRRLVFSDNNDLEDGISYVSTNITAGTTDDDPRQPLLSTSISIENGLPGSVPHSSSPSSTDTQIYPLTPYTSAFLLGDLNYRTASTRPTVTPASTSTTSSTTTFDDIQALWESDQLRARMSAGSAFQGLCEAEITFRPSYKYELNSERLVSNRWPSWTDRILYWADGEASTRYNHTSSGSSTGGSSNSGSGKGSGKGGIKVRKYGLVEGYSGSDHRGVYMWAEMGRGEVIRPSDTPAAMGADETVLVPPPGWGTSSAVGTGNVAPEVTVEDSWRPIRPPFEMEKEWREKRLRAKRWEVIIGGLVAASLSWVVWGIVFGGVLGVWWVWGRLRESGYA